MIKLILLFTILLLGLAGCASTHPFVEHVPSFAQAKQYYQQGKYKTAYQALSLLAQQGDPKAQYALGYMYYQGEGTAKNLNLAQGWFKAAAKQGNQDAKNALKTIQLTNRNLF